MSGARDVWIDRIVLGTLAWIVVAGGAGITALAALDREVPQVLVGVFGAAAGAMAGWFSRRRNGE